MNAYLQIIETGDTQMTTTQTAAEKFAERERARIEFEKAKAERDRREANEREFRRYCED